MSPEASRRSPGPQTSTAGPAPSSAPANSLTRTASQTPTGAGRTAGAISPPTAGSMTTAAGSTSFGESGCAPEHWRWARFRGLAEPANIYEVPADYFGEDVAEHFDRRYAHLEARAIVDPMVEFISGFANGGAALELGVGTGRIALPLAARGVRVHGIDLSGAMISRLRAKPGSEKVSVTVGDIATTSVEGVFSVAYIVANTIMNLTTQDEQVACFQNVGAHLEPHGYFVMEVLVPRLQRLPPGETYQPFAVTQSHLGFDEYDVVQQRVISHHYWIDGDEVQVISPPFRYVWPSELDLMARIAGMTLRERRSGSQRDPFTADTAKHVSVWQMSVQVRCCGASADLANR